MEPLPQNRIIAMRLLYRDKITPHNYQPEYFQDASNDPDGMKLDSDAMKVSIGDVSTPYHQINLKIRCQKSQMMNIDLAECTVTDSQTINTFPTSISKPVHAEQDDNRTQICRTRTPSPQASSFQILLTHLEHDS